MKKLSRPNFAARATFEACVASIEKGPLKDRLSKIVNKIESAEKDYLARGENGTLYEIAQSEDVGGIVTREDMKRVYKGTFVKSVRTRQIYDSIKKLPPNDICPLCSQRTVFTLDHYLPQSFHPALVVVPANLLPACGECNKMKLDTQPELPEEQLFHPYFDNFDDDRWLYAAVEETVPASVAFSVAPPNAWPETKQDRVKKHFATFGLGALYASHSGVELTNIRYYLQGLAKRGSAEMISSFLKEQAQSAFEAHRNSWKTATYFAFSESEWFCCGGFART